MKNKLGHPIRDVGTSLSSQRPAYTLLSCVPIERNKKILSLPEQKILKNEEELFLVDEGHVH